MINELLFYKYNILAGCLMAFCLALIAPALLSRRQAPFIFSFSQVSINVLLFSLILNIQDNKILVAVLGAIFCLLMQKISTRVSTEKEYLVHTSVFVSLYSLNQFLISKYSQLHAYSNLHNTGDLVTLLNSEALIISALSVFFIFIAFLFQKQILRLNFKSSIGLTLASTHFLDRFAGSILLYFYYLVLSISNLYFGFLFTTGSFFLLSLFATFTAKNTISYYLQIAIVLLFSLPAAFFLSQLINLITVPTLLLIYLLFFLILRALKTILKV